MKIIKSLSEAKSQIWHENDSIIQGVRNLGSIFDHSRLAFEPPLFRNAVTHRRPNTFSWHAGDVLSKVGKFAPLNSENYALQKCAEKYARKFVESPITRPRIALLDSAETRTGKLGFFQKKFLGL